MRHLVRQSIKGGRCSILNQNYKSTILDEVFNGILKKIDINGNTSEILDKNFEYKIKHRKITGDKNDSLFEDYRDINQEDKKNMLLVDCLYMKNYKN